MKKMLLAGTALLTFLSSSAMAADLSRPTAPAPVYSKAPMMPAFSWTGFYIGGDGGYGYATSSGSSVSPGFGARPHSSAARRLKSRITPEISQE